MTNHLLGSYFQVKSFLQDSSIDVTPMWHAIKIIKENRKTLYSKHVYTISTFYYFHHCFFPLKDILDIFVTYLPLEYEDQVYLQRQYPHSLAEASLKKLLILQIHKITHD